MNCPPDLAKILAAILRTGVLRIRNSGWDGRRCAIEADHLHNLPTLLADYSPEALRYYWEVERPSFLSQIAGESVAGFEAPWGQLERWMSGARQEDMTTNGAGVGP
jgi:hypothetical protein